MATGTVESDKGIGLGILFSLLAGAGAVGMYLGAPESLAAWAFAAAMILGSLSVVAIHFYWH